MGSHAKDPDQPPPYKTTDLLTAAYLVQQGFAMSCNAVSATEVEFSFPQSDALQEALRELRRAEARVEPRAFHAAWVDLRRKIDDALEEARYG